MSELKSFRRRSREAALAYLFQMDAEVSAVTSDLQKFISHFQVTEESQEYFRKLAVGVTQSQQEIDRKIEEVAENWKLYRMESVDRCLLRLALWELMECPETDYQVILDEAVEMAKEFGSENSAAFVNGILDKLAKLIRPIK